MPFPIERPRRLRRTATLRRMVRETTLSAADFVLPLFACGGKGVRREIKSMPGVAQLSVDGIVKEAKLAASVGVPAVILFGIPEDKDAEGSRGWDASGPVAVSVAEIKSALPEMLVITDVCMCEYTDHGHCGPLTRVKSGEACVDNDRTLDLLAREALCHARAGADIVAPSDMMDGRVGHIRAALDAEGFADIAILSYAAKYASAFYGPFREAAESAPKEGDRRGYQMDPANRREALREVRLDLDEGADMIMVKPALSYLDVIREVRDAVDVPVAAYNVSGEYSMVKAAAKAGMIDEERAMMEILLSIKRAGADFILTYHAIEAARALAKGPV
ncbi:MAG: porphobilinogen synthase [Sandaracinaceae bacterium]|jgi:porphobilinogen synthase|nr:porphobilinogen synthase [Sandaracinaceae bacterium]